MQKTNKELISIIVPVYKVEKYLDRCVESLLNQNYKNVEVILVDDGSPDSSPEICDKWAEKDNRVKVVHKPNGGVSSARNEGLKVAKGEYICFCDSDDTVKPKIYELMHKKIKTNDMVFCKIKKVYDNRIEDLDEINLFELEKNKNNIIPFYIYKPAKNNITNNIMGSLTRTMLKASIIKDNNLSFNQNLFYQEDKEFILRYLTFCNSVGLVDDYLYNYFIYEDSACRTSKNFKIITKNLKTLFLEERKTILINTFLSLREKKKLLKYAAMNYIIIIATKYVQSSATKEDIKKLFLDEDFKMLLKVAGIFFTPNKYMKIKKYFGFLLVKFKLMCIFKKIKRLS